MSALLKRSVVLVLVVLGTVMITRWFFRERAQEGNEAPSSSFVVADNVLERDVLAILKLALVRDSYEEYFSQQDSKVMARILQGLGFRKGAMLRVTGKVTAGFEVTERSISTEPKQRTVRIMLPRDPSIISVEHDVDYLDLQQGVLNRFKAEDLTELNAQGKKRILAKALSSDLFARTRAKRTEVLDVIGNYVRAQGWELLVDSTFTSPTDDGQDLDRAHAALQEPLMQQETSKPN